MGPNDLLTRSELRDVLSECAECMPEVAISRRVTRRALIRACPEDRTA